MNISKLNLPEGVRPEWAVRSGIPACTSDGRDCPSFDGKRCAVMGMRPGTVCEPAVEAMARAIPGFLSCWRCRGTGTVEAPCSDPQCGDSTWDHECDDGRKVPCSYCDGTGKPQITEHA